jgi:serine/threonine protein kinase
MLGKIIGSGTFGNVYEYEKDDELFVVKVVSEKYKNYFQHEIKILELINGKSNCCHLLGNSVKNNKLYLKFPKYNLNLYQCKDTYSEQEIFNITNQILDGLDYLQNLNIIHGDLKPENLMFEDNSHKNIKIIDFGSSIILNKGNTFYSKTYYQSRWYCSPDVILGLNLTHHIDLWSLGCIIYELATKEALFMGKGCENKLRYKQLKEIFSLVDLPKISYIKKSPIKEKYFDIEYDIFIWNIKNYKLKSDYFGDDFIPGTRKLEHPKLTSNIKIIIGMILRYENRKTIDEIQEKINDCSSNKKIKI